MISYTLIGDPTAGAIRRLGRGVQREEGEGLVSLAYRRVNVYELERGLHEPEEGEVLVDTDRMTALWRYDGRAPDGTRLYDLVLGYKEAGEAQWTGKAWSFCDREAYESFLKDCEARGARIKSVAEHGGAESVLEAVGVCEGWFRVTVSKPPATKAEGDLVMTNLSLFAESADRSHYSALVTPGELGLLSRSGVEFKLIQRDGGAPPPVTPVRLPSGLLRVDIRRHPLALRILMASGQLPGPATPWKSPALHKGVIYLDDTGWDRLATHLRAVGIPTAEIVEPTLLQLTEGWDAPARTGEQLYEYQRAGIRFLAQRGNTGLLGDEMGLGKTVQAIRSAEGTGMRRIAVVAPAVARWVWDAEIRKWHLGNGEPTTYHVSDTAEVDIPADAKWVIMTYDQLAQREASVSLNVNAAVLYEAVTGRKCGDEARSKMQMAEAAAEELVRSRTEVTRVVVKGPEFTVVRLRRPLPFARPEALPEEALSKLERANRRLSGALLAALRAWEPDLVILDEAHRVKNRRAKRSLAIAELLDSMPHRRVMLLTGTPVRNHAGEVRQLLGLMDPEGIAKAKGADPSLVRGALKRVMLRRKKADVLSQLPAITRQTLELDIIDEELLKEYYSLMADAMREYAEAYDLARREGLSEPQADAVARQTVLALLSKARRLLGTAKAGDPRVAELILDVTQTGQKVAVFLHHKDAFAALERNLVERGIRCVRLSGEMDQKARAEAVDQFNSSSGPKVFLGSVTIMESISLSNVGTYFLLEFPWVPAEILQAEARLIRPAQDLAARYNILAVQIVARIEEPNLDLYIQKVLQRKLETIGFILDDATMATAMKSVASEVIDWVVRKSR